MSERSGTEKRQRNHLVGVRFSDEEFAAVQARAKSWECSLAEAVRWPAVDWETALEAAHTEGPLADMGGTSNPIAPRVVRGDGGEGRDG